MNRQQQLARSRRENSKKKISSGNRRKKREYVQLDLFETLWGHIYEEQKKLKLKQTGEKKNDRNL